MQEAARPPLRSCCQSAEWGDEPSESVTEVACPSDRRSVHPINHPIVLLTLRPSAQCAVRLINVLSVRSAFTPSDQLFFCVPLDEVGKLLH